MTLNQKLVIFNKKLRFLNVYHHHEENKYYFDIPWFAGLAATVKENQRIIPPTKNNWYLNADAIKKLSNTDDIIMLVASPKIEKIYNIFKIDDIPLKSAISYVKDVQSDWKELTDKEKELLMFSPGWSAIIKHELNENIKWSVFHKFDINNPRFRTCKSLKRLDADKYYLRHGQIHHKSCPTIQDRLFDCFCFDH